MFKVQPKMIVLFLYALVCNILKTNSGTTMLKVNMDENKLLDVSKFPNLLSSLQEEMEDPVFSIITSPANYENSWIKRSIEKYCTDCQNSSIVHLSSGRVSDVKNKTVNLEKEEEVLDCGKPVNFTYYDNLVGVANRLTHPNVPESQMGLIYKKKGSDFDVEALERKLKKAKKEKPKSIQLYNQIGNFWRIKGDSYKSIECFRRALAVSPHNAEVLLNLARVLFNLQYLDDAIYLTRRSLEVQPPDRSAWQQYFTLGEIFKAYGHYQEGTLHMRHCLQLKPGFDPAIEALNEMEAIPDSTIHLYTLLIIVCLVMGVLLVVVSSVECVGGGGEVGGGGPSQVGSCSSSQGGGGGIEGGRRRPGGGSGGHRRGGGRGVMQQSAQSAGGGSTLLGGGVSAPQARLLLLPPPHHFTPHLPPFPPADSTARTALSVTLTSSIVALMYIVYLF